MSTRHAFGYSRSARAKCHGSPPCRDSILPVGTLRYGQTINGEFGETVEWRHWGCVNSTILEQLAVTPLEGVTGFQDLKPEDQRKIRLSVSMRRVDPGDVPDSAKIRGSSSAHTTTTAISHPSKRTAAQAGLDQAAARVGLQTVSAYSTFQPAEEDIEDIPEEEVKDELYCIMTTTVVGIQYYKGMVGPGEEVLLVREPQNPYDRNAIQVKNISRVQVGHLPRTVASKLAPLLDRKAVTVEGVINDGNISGSRGYTLSITLKMYGASDKRRELEPLLIWATPGQRGFPSSNASSRSSASASTSTRIGNITQVAPSSSQRRPNASQTPAQMEAIRKQQEALQKAAELRQMLSNLEKVDDEGRRSSMLDTLCPADDAINLPLHSSPPGILSGELTVDLLKHQLQALQWCIDRENPVLPSKETDKPVQFWQLRKNGNQTYYYNIATKTPQEARPPLGRGALNADAMGLGKTLTMIALVIATKADMDPGFSKSTLIVAPLSVLSNWEKQIEEHCTPGTLSTCVYYGSNRGLSAAELQKYDIVVTTYQTVTGEHDEDATAGAGPAKKKKRTDKNLFDMQWKRVVLDEGHNIRNPKTKMARAVVALNASRRWVLTGTPIINSPRDLGSILTFLRICQPLDNEDFYKRLLLRPLKNGEVSGTELLRALMSHICIRRTKEMHDSSGVPILALPSVEMIKVPVALNEEARQLYNEVEHLSKQRLENLMNGGMTHAVQSNVLSMLTRMRQIALHPGLVPANYLEELRAAEANETAPKPVVITPADRMRLQYVLAQAIEDCEECPVCFSFLPNDARITSCTHMFCLACITEILSRDPKCPMDRRPLTAADLHEPPPPTDLTQKPIRDMGEVEPQGIRAGSSAKIDQLVHLLNLTPPTEKSLVFSQFTSYLDKIAETLDAEGIPYVRFDGQMSSKRRRDAITKFSVPLEQEQSTTQRTNVRSRRSTTRDDDSYNSDPMDDDAFVDEDAEQVFSKKSKCKGKDKTKNVRSGSANGDENPRVMLLSLKAGALGLNLTVANNVYLMDPWWQEGIESQAVDRVNRIGQKKAVHVYQLIAENTVESKVLDIQAKKKQLIQQAFSGIKRTETPRQQREARLQDLVELFGIRRQASQAS